MINEDQKPSSNLNTLPLNMLTYLCQFLNLRDRIALSMVCNRTYEKTAVFSKSTLEEFTLFLPYKNLLDKTNFLKILEENTYPTGLKNTVIALMKNRIEYCNAILKDNTTLLTMMPWFNEKAAPESLPQIDSLIIELTKRALKNSIESNQIQYLILTLASNSVHKNVSVMAKKRLSETPSSSEAKIMLDVFLKAGFFAEIDYDFCYNLYTNTYMEINHISETHNIFLKNIITDGDGAIFFPSQLPIQALLFYLKEPILLELYQKEINKMWDEDPERNILTNIFTGLYINIWDEEDTLNKENVPTFTLEKIIFLQKLAKQYARELTLKDRQNLAELTFAAPEKAIKLGFMKEPEENTKKDTIAWFNLNISEAKATELQQLITSIEKDIDNIISLDIKKLTRSPIFSKVLAHLMKEASTPIELLKSIIAEVNDSRDLKICTRFFKAILVSKKYALLVEKIMPMNLLNKFILAAANYLNSSKYSSEFNDCLEAILTSENCHNICNKTDLFFTFFVKKERNYTGSKSGFSSSLSSSNQSDNSPSYPVVCNNILNPELAKSSAKVVALLCMLFNIDLIGQEIKEFTEKLDAPVGSDWYQSRITIKTKQKTAMEKYLTCFIQGDFSELTHEQEQLLNNDRDARCIVEWIKKQPELLLSIKKQPEPSSIHEYHEQKKGCTIC